MGVFGAVAARQIEELDRRVEQRRECDCPATFLTTIARRTGRLCDITEAGAKLELDDPPAHGTSGLLRWDDHEYFCTVVWSKSDSCGLAFERRIPLHVVDKTAPVTEVEAGPVANFGRIPVAQKGRRSLVSGG